MRGVTFDVTGLPPTSLEIDAFRYDLSPQAHEAVVDRLLDSPAYGERWARHWLDLVRYGETDGHEFDADKVGAQHYRDYVIRAFNMDLRYDQFVFEQVAGDLIPEPRINPETGINESAIATAFYWLGERVHSPVDLRDNEAERIDNQLDVFGKTFFGLSLGCARCHNHKFDPISQDDYYALSGYLKSSRYAVVPLFKEASLKKSVAQLEEVRDRLVQLSSSPTSELGVLLSDKRDVVFEDFSSGDFRNWILDGPAFGKAPLKNALVLQKGPNGDRPVLIGGPGIADSGSLSTKLQSALRSKTFTITKRYVLTHSAGVNCDVNVIVDGFQRIQDPIYGGLKYRPDGVNHLEWHVQDVNKWIGHKAYLELLDNGNGRVMLDRVVFSDRPNILVSDVMTSHDNARQVSFDNSEIDQLLQRRTELEKSLSVPDHSIAMIDGSPEDATINLRGSPKTPGNLAPRHFLTMLGSGSMSSSVHGSGRFELADRMITVSRSLLSRVFVNRIWQHHFGDGLVRTPDDFGTRGQQPTHPELLDYLCNQFIKNGWSMKKLHRSILLSSTYRMSGQSIANSNNIDPQNKLLHCFRPHRLEAEAIRDNILAVSGRLERKMFGPSVMPFLTSFMDGRGRPSESGPLDGNGRRSIYIGVRRNFLVPMFLAFDFPIPFNTMGRRTESNVPAQALTLMNDPFVYQQSELWAKKVISSNRSQDSRIDDIYLTALGRNPDTAEISKAKSYLSGISGTELEKWSNYCHAVINLKEFIFVK